jgi:hypothetical protein
MDTKPLERFATWARRELINAVDAQATAVLALGSIARSERAEVVEKLETEIASHGRQLVVDKVAYTWFNRIIALRFMDARGYTNAGVVSPAQAQSQGQPEILADAKRGNLDTDAVTNTRTAEAIIGLLDGTRRSTDAEGEAYALLLTEYCRHWQESMPFMFEREGDYTELLVPANLLADGAILARAREALTVDVCGDVEVIGWLYQFYISERKEEIFAGLTGDKKVAAGEIPAATQLFTPHWIVRYLVENSLGRLWMLNRPSSRLVDKMDFYIAPVENKSDYLKIIHPEEITVIDPACGSGHMLTYAFELLYAIYEEEGYAPSEIPRLILIHNLHGTEIDPRAGSLAAFALTMKAREKQRTLFSERVEPNIRVIEALSFDPHELDLLSATSLERRDDEVYWNQFEHADTLGSLVCPNPVATSRAISVLSARVDDGDIFHNRTAEKAQKLVEQAVALSQRYSVVIANPPYMGGGAMVPQLATYLRERFPEGKADLFAAFILRCRALTADGGATAMVTMQSWMFLSSYEKLRAIILRDDSIASMLHLGTRAFDQIGGEVVSAVAFVLDKGSNPEGTGVYVRLVDGRSEAAKTATLHAALAERTKEAGFHTAKTSEFAQIAGAPIVYWLSPAMRNAFAAGKPLGAIGLPKAGMHGGDISRFARLWHEVAESSSNRSASSTAEVHADGRKWVGLNKGGSFRKWYGNQEYVLAFDRATYGALAILGNKLPSRDYYFRPSVSWSKVSSGAPAFRLYPQGFVFDVAGTPVFASYRERVNIVAVANSEMARMMLSALAPTLNFEIGQIASLPILDFATDEGEVSRIEELVATSKTDWDSFETSWEFENNAILRTHAVTRHALADAVEHLLTEWDEQSLSQQARETANNLAVARLFGLESEVPCDVPMERVSLTRNTAFRWPGKSAEARQDLATKEAIRELISYAVGCMYGRYSLDERGIILADQGATLQDYLAKIPSPIFTPDEDNVIPFVDDGWFEDDIVERFRQFIRVALGAVHFEENMRFINESLGLNTLRDYFITKGGRSRFYDDHVQRYKKRPIYWMFSSPNGSFNALVYMHRCTPSTVSTVLNDYLREYRAKLEVALFDIEKAVAGGSVRDQKEADRLRKVLVELAEYERDVLYPLASRQLPMDLDDGVLVNYLRFGSALKDIGLEKDRRKVEGWTWPMNSLDTV